jgi:hypothetical protein
LKTKAGKGLNPLEIIPGIGPSMAEDLNALGIFKVTDLRKKDPQKMYDDLNALRGVRNDRCVLYVFRCAVYFAEAENPDPELLKWWNWKEK